MGQPLPAREYIAALSRRTMLLTKQLACPRQARFCRRIEYRLQLLAEAVSVGRRLRARKFPFASLPGETIRRGPPRVRGEPVNGQCLQEDMDFQRFQRVAGRSGEI